MVFGDGQLGIGESAAVSQTSYVSAVCQPPDESVDSSSDNCVADAGQASQLAKAAALIQVHCQQQLVLSGEQVDSASQQVSFVSVAPFQLGKFSRHASVQFPHQVGTYTFSISKAVFVYLLLNLVAY